MKHPEKGTRVWVVLGSKRIAGIVLGTGFSWQGEYDLCKVELLMVNQLAPSQLLRQVYPRILDHDGGTYCCTRRMRVKRAV